MVRGIFRNLFLLFCVMLVKSAIAQNDLGDCKVNVVDLNDMLSKLNEAIEGSSTVNFVDDCSELVRNLISASSRKRNSLRKRRAEVSRKYDEMKAALTSRRRQKSKPLKNLSDELKEKYGSTFAFLLAEIQKIQSEIDNELKKEANIIEKIQFYELGASLSSDSNDQFCALTDDNGRQLIRNMLENYLFLTDTNFNDKCKVLVNKMINIRSFEDNSFEYEEKKLGLLNKTFTERSRIVDILLKDNEEGLRDFENMKQENFDDFWDILKETAKKNLNLEKQLVVKAHSFAVTMLQRGKHFEEVQTAIEDSKNEYIDPFAMTLERAYTCKAEYLENIVKFIGKYSWTGYPVILEQMKTCKQLDNPIVLKIAKLYKGGAGAHVEEAYLKLAKNVQTNETDRVIEIVENLGSENIDLPKIIRLSYEQNTKNFQLVAKFIKKLGTVPENLEEVFYDEMMNSGHVDTQEHVMFGIFIKMQRIEAHKQVDFVRFQNLEALKNRLPDGIRNLCFASAVLFEGPNAYMIGGRSGFKAFPYNSGNFFRFEDTTNQRLFMYRIDTESKRILGYGKSDDQDAFFWKVIPTDNAKYFYIRNRAEDYSMSSFEIYECLWYKSFLIFRTDECGKWLLRNILLNPQEPAQKWMIRSA